VHRVADRFTDPGHGDFIEHLAVDADGLVTVAPRDGESFPLRVRAGDTGADAFQVRVGADGVREVHVNSDLVEGRTGVHADMVVTQAIGHTTGEAAAEQAGRRFGLVSHFDVRDSLTNDIAVGDHRKMSAKDLAETGEYRALAQLRDTVTGPRRIAVGGAGDRALHRLARPGGRDAGRQAQVRAGAPDPERSATARSRPGRGGSSIR
jgi:hypothetical protein